MATSSDESLSTSIVTFGKGGTGKSSLALAIAGKENDLTKAKEGFRSVTKESDETTFQVENVTVKIIDTSGMMDTESTRDDKTVHEISQMLTNDFSGVFVVCIDMYERLDSLTVQILAQINRRLGMQFWLHAVIALTKADRYEEDDWDKEWELENKKSNISKSDFYRKKFSETIEDRSSILKEVFTACREDVKESCFFDMTNDDYDRLKIPIIPTSRLNAAKKMYKVGCVHWFDQLIVKCCQREQGSKAGLLQIHKQRLLCLPPDLAKNLQLELDDEMNGSYAKSRRAKNQAISYVASTMERWFETKRLWSLYCDQVNTWPRFDKKSDDDCQTED